MYMVQLVISDENNTLSFDTNIFVILVLIVSSVTRIANCIFFFFCIQIFRWKVYYLKFTDMMSFLLVFFYKENYQMSILIILDIIYKAFSRFSVPEVSTIKRFPDGLNVMELFHGPTWSFRDISLSCVGQFLSYFYPSEKNTLSYLVVSCCRSVAP